ncbi:hypothetical protein EVAR_28049_1 [Eumeta japonica]|uniref:Uncharacterized protein n=1 Tax=Eumeta variegata TaxID=151549 RepID=A0A4C1W6D4_EUMVA|nr:hypothetical protein EVAR_28049_1 [Eumeta japonica]
MAPFWSIDTDISKSNRATRTTAESGGISRPRIACPRTASVPDETPRRFRDGYSYAPMSPSNNESSEAQLASSKLVRLTSTSLTIPVLVPPRATCK